MKLPVVDRIHPQSTMVDMGVENKAMGDSKHNDSPGQGINETHDKAFFGQVLAIMYLPNSHSHSSPQNFISFSTAFAILGASNIFPRNFTCLLGTNANAVGVALSYLTLHYLRADIVA